jgi:peptidoglycan-associated lipoprotein|nr:peptidoglycan-associated lipoprotein Pal [uncultured Rhodoferax sp.]
MKQLLLATAVAVFLSACSSTKLDTVPVEDKSGTNVGQQSGGAGTGGVGERAVTPVALDKNKVPDVANRVVYFDYDSYAIRPEFQALIETNAKLVKADKTKKIVVEGHTDERGGREYNLALGQKRAEAVRRAMGLLGVAESQLEAVSFGKEKPAVMGSTEDAMAKNRRAEISYR